MSDYNVQAEIEDIIVTEGDTLNMTWDVYCDTGSGWVLYDLTGKSVDMHVRKCDGTLIETYTTSGGSPEITYVGARMTIYAQQTALMRRNKYKFDIQVTNGAEILTIRKGNFFIQQQITV